MRLNDLCDLLGGAGSDDPPSTPAASTVDAVGRTGTDALNALTGKEVSDKWLKHTMTTAGAVFNLPLGQPASDQALPGEPLGTAAFQAVKGQGGIGLA